MKKLILKYREKGDYFLLERTENSESVIGEIEPKNEFPYSLPLSKNNCDELFGIYNPSELSELIKSLQQPTEIEVEFEMQETEPAGENVWMSPKLDENGILILKRK